MNTRVLLAAALTLASAPAIAADPTATTCKPQGHSVGAVFGAAKCLFGYAPASPPQAQQQPAHLADKAKTAFTATQSVKKIAKEKIKEKVLRRLLH